MGARPCSRRVDVPAMAHKEEEDARERSAAVQMFDAAEDHALPREEEVSVRASRIVGIGATADAATSPVVTVDPISHPTPAPRLSRILGPLAGGPLLRRLLGDGLRLGGLECLARADERPRELALVERGQLDVGR